MGCTRVCHADLCMGRFRPNEATPVQPTCGKPDANAFAPTPSCEWLAYWRRDRHDAAGHCRTRSPLEPTRSPCRRACQAVRSTATPHRCGSTQPRTQPVGAFRSSFDWPVDLDYHRTSLDFDDDRRGRSHAAAPRALICTGTKVSATCESAPTPPSPARAWPIHW